MLGCRRLFCAGVGLLAIVVLSATCVAAPAAAATFPDGTTKVCQLPNGALVPEANNPYQNFAGLTQPMPYPPGYRISYNIQLISSFAAAVGQAVQAALQMGVAGVTPGDVSNAQLFQWKLTAYHECTHARTGAGSNAEVAVNCTAVLSMLNDGTFSGHDIDVQTLAMSSPGVGSFPQPFQYGGSLGAFWSLTMQCVNWAIQNPGVAPPPGVAPALALDPL